jgi:polyisoprenoid-binding protein YceI
MMAWKIDASHSLVEFSVKHMMITTVRGRFNEFDGEIVIDETNPANSYATGTVQTASIDSRDANRDGHLRSPDFFDVESYPTMSFRSTRLEPLGGDRYKVVGDLTIRDVTREVEFTVTDEGGGRDPWGGERRSFSAETTINRKDFGLNWNVALETGGWLVGEQVKIHAEIQVVQQQEEALATA